MTAAWNFLKECYFKNQLSVCLSFGLVLSKYLSKYDFIYICTGGPRDNSKVLGLVTLFCLCPDAMQGLDSAIHKLNLFDFASVGTKSRSMQNVKPWISQDAQFGDWEPGLGCAANCVHPMQTFISDHGTRYPCLQCALLEELGLVRSSIYRSCEILSRMSCIRICKSRTLWTKEKNYNNL